MREVSGVTVAGDSEEQLRFVASAIPALIAYLDTDVCFVWANEAYRRWFGHPPERLRGLHASEVLGPATWALVRPCVERVLAGEEVSLDHPLMSANGPPRDVRAFYIPHRDAAGRVRGFAVMLNEIAKTPGVDAALRRSEHMLERSQSSAHVGSWEVTMVDHPGGHAGAVQWSDETYRLLGFEPGAVQITDAGFLDYVHRDERQPLCDEWTAFIRRGEPFESDFRIVRPDGTVRLLHTWTDFERDAQGRMTHMVGTCQDVTDRKRAERELLEADRRKDEFLAMLSHELRNPLAPILNAVEILHGAKPDDHELAVNYRAIIARQVRHMKRLLDDLLDVSRVRQGKIQLQKRPIELGALLLEAVEISRPLIAEKRQQLSLALAEDLLPMEADPTRLVQVFANLLNNAAKYTDAHGHIMLAVTVEDGEAVVKVRDDGTGMTPELLAHVFDLFVQETRSLDRAQGGLGIGLTMVRTLVQMHGGSVRALSDGPGRGSEFVVRLPLATPAPAGTTPREKPQSTAVGARHVLRVLVVDDNTDATQALQHLLEQLGHDVTVAHDGPGALAAAAAGVGPDLVLLDIGLPGMDGYAVAAALREAGHDRAALVALTGYAQGEHQHRSSRAGFDRHLVKPVDFATIYALTREVAARSAAQ